MKLVNSNSAHYEGQQYYLNYIKSIKVGDTVYPAYDGKSRRATVCKVVNIKDDKLVVEGKFWGDDEDKVITALFDYMGEGWVVYREGEPTLMDFIFDKNEDEPSGNFYRLMLPEGFTSDVFKSEYLLELGFTNVY